LAAGCARTRDAEKSVPVIRCQFWLHTRVKESSMPLLGALTAGQRIRRWQLLRPLQGKYVKVCRLFAFIKRSIDHDTEWVLFEPNRRVTLDA
jgi:hypothetical protein